MPSFAKFDEWYTTSGVKRQAILQVKHTIMTTPFTTTALINVGGARVFPLSTSITPLSPTSRIFILIDGVVNGTSAVTQVYGYIGRGNVKIGVGGQTLNRRGIGFRHYYQDPRVTNPFIFSAVDTPQTTTELTYDLYVGTQGSGTIFFGRTETDDDSATDSHRCSTRLTLMEIQA